MVGTEEDVEVVEGAVDVVDVVVAGVDLEAEVVVYFGAELAVDMGAMLVV